MPVTIPFVKMHGAGNDFVMLDGRDGLAAQLDRARIAFLCDRRRGVGADGLMVIDGSARRDFAMTYYNSDGGEAGMCGNGARCAMAFARRLGLVGEEGSFDSAAGVVAGRFVGEEVEVSLPPWHGLELDVALDGSPWRAHHRVDTGVPHLVVFVDDVDDVDPERWGPVLRGHEALGDAGANVNWVEPERDGVRRMRTYERGVEAETLACGTGASAVAVVTIALGRASSPVVLRTRGGDLLTVAVVEEGRERELRLRGPAVTSFTGEVRVP